jgi:hypothetical protein
MMGSILADIDEELGAKSYIKAIDYGLQNPGMLGNLAVDLHQSWGDAELAVRVWIKALQKEPRHQNNWQQLLSAVEEKLDETSLKEIINTPPGLKRLRMIQDELDINEESLQEVLSEARVVLEEGDVLNEPSPRNVKEKIAKIPRIAAVS